MVSCLVIPTNELSIYIKQGNLEQFIDRFKYYADNFGTVYILNQDFKTIEYDYRNIEILNFKKSKNKIFEIISLIRNVYRSCKKYDITFIRIVEGGTFTKTFCGGLVGKLLRKKVVASIHGHYRRYDYAKIFNFSKVYLAFCFLFSKISGMFIDLTFVVNSSDTYLFKGWHCVTVLPNYYSKKRFHSRNVKKEFDLIYVGSLIPKKNIAGLIRIFKRLKRDNKNIRLLIIGFGSERIPRIGGIVNMGSVDNTRLVEHYNKSKIFITASFQESFCIPIIEAQACGLSVVAYEQECYYENTMPGKTSLLCKMNDEQCMVDGVNYLLEKNRWKVARQDCINFVNKFERENVLKLEIASIKKSIESGF